MSQSFPAVAPVLPVLHALLSALAQRSAGHACCSAQHYPRRPASELEQQMIQSASQAPAVVNDSNVRHLLLLIMIMKYISLCEVYIAVNTCLLQARSQIVLPCICPGYHQGIIQPTGAPMCSKGMPQIIDAAPDSDQSHCEAYWPVDPDACNINRRACTLAPLRHVDDDSN